MPNRILKESICTSDSIDRLSWFEEVVFYRLIVNCDDYGRFDGRVALIKNKLFPLKESVTFTAVENAINKLATVGLVTLYEYEGRQYLQLPTWNEHQSIRAKRSKFPSPDGCVKSSEIICKQMNANVPVIQSESESNPNPNPKSARVDSALFDRFYAAYPRKQGKSKAMDAFKKLSPDEALLNAMLSALEVQKTSAQWTKDGGQFIPHPATWLNQRRWEDEAMPQNGNGGMRKSRSLNGAHNHHQRTYTDADLDKIGIDLLGDEDDE